MAGDVQQSIRNRLLAALGAADYDLLRPDLEPVTLELRQPLNTPDEPIEHVYFLDSGIGSIVVGPERTTGVEIGIVGREGLIGTSVILGAGQSPHTIFIQLAGRGWRIPSERLRTAMSASPSLQGLLLRYVHAFMMQVSSTAYANADFIVEERLARWILMCHDRVDDDNIAMTHEFIALMLGVRRPGVTVATHVLEGEHMIRARRGLITVLDREKLIKTADGGYGMAEAEYERVIRGATGANATSVVRFPTGTAT